MPKPNGYVLNYVILTTHFSHLYSIWDFTHTCNQHFLLFPLFLTLPLLFPTLFGSSSPHYSHLFYCYSSSNPSSLFLNFSYTYFIFYKFAISLIQWMYYPKKGVIALTFSDSLLSLVRFFLCFLVIFPFRNFIS